MAEAMVLSILETGGFSLLATALNNVCYQGKIYDNDDVETPEEYENIQDVLDVIYEEIIPAMKKLA